MKLRKEVFKWCIEYYFFCPGCNEEHSFRTENKVHPNWSFNGNMESPTFTPSLKYIDGSCHLTLTNGKIQYHGDCMHSLAGQIIDLPELKNYD